MELYTFRAKNPRGEVFEDTIQAGSVEEAAVAIRAKQLQPLTIKRKEGIGGGVLSRSISISEKASLCRFLGTMLRSGMSLPEAVEIIKDETKNKKLKKILSDIYFQTQKGKSLSMVISQYKDDFDPIFQTMIRVGEESGTIEKSFDYLSKQLTASHELQQKVVGSMMYPLVIVGAMMGNALLMLLFVLPRIAGVFLKLDLPLPAYTKVILIMGKFFGENVILVIAAVVLFVVLSALFIILKTTRGYFMSFIVRMPVLKKIVQQIDIARFSRTLSTLLKSGVPIMEALDVSADTLTQGSLKREAKLFSKSVEKGESLAAILMRNRGVFPATMIQTVKAGEKSGTLEQVLEEMADFYEKEVDFSLKRLTALLEPVLMLVIGVAVGVMVIMMIAPIYSLIGGLQQTIEK